MSDIKEVHIKYLAEIVDFEEKRQNTIDTKLTQIMGTFGVIITLNGVFITFVQNYFNGLPWQLVLVLFLFYGAGMSLLLVGIYEASKVLKITKYPYATFSHKTVDNANLDSVEKFYDEQIKDLKTCIEKNTALDNEKGSILNKAYGQYKLGIGFILLFIIILVAAFNFYKKEENKTFISNQLNIETINKELLNVNQNLNNINKTLKELMVDSNKGKPKPIPH